VNNGRSSTKKVHMGDATFEEGGHSALFLRHLDSPGVFKGIAIILEECQEQVFRPD